MYSFHLHGKISIYPLPTGKKKKKKKSPSATKGCDETHTTSFLTCPSLPGCICPASGGCSSLGHLLIAGGHTRDKHLLPCSVITSHTGLVSGDKGEQKRWWRGCHSPSFKTLFDILEAGVDMLYLESQERRYVSNLNKTCIYKKKPHKFVVS